MTKFHRNCILCRAKIPATRLLVLPQTRVCKDCSKVRKVTQDDVDLDGADREEVLKSASDGGFGNENG